MATVSRSLWFICVIVLMGLDILGAEAVGKPLQAVGLWLSATGLLYGCGAMVLWPRQLVASNAGNLGTRRPGVARGIGVFGLVIAVLFETLIWVTSKPWRLLSLRAPSLWSGLFTQSRARHFTLP